METTQESSGTQTRRGLVPRPGRRLIQTNIYLPPLVKDRVEKRVLSLNVEAQDPGAWTLSRWFVDLAARELGIVFDEES